MVGFDGVYNTITESFPLAMDVHFGGEGHAIYAIGRANSNIGVRYVMVMDGVDMDVLYAMDIIIA